MDAAVVAGAGDVESVSASGTAASRLPPLVVAPFSSLLLFFLGVFFSAAVRYDLRCGPSLGLVGYRSTTNTLPYWIFF